MTAGRRLHLRNGVPFVADQCDFCDCRAVGVRGSGSRIVRRQRHNDGSGRGDGVNCSRF